MRGVKSPTPTRADKLTLLCIQGLNPCGPGIFPYPELPSPRVARSLLEVLVLSGISRKHSEPHSCHMPISSIRPALPSLSVQFVAFILAGTESHLLLPCVFQKPITQNPNGSQHGQHEDDRDHWVPLKERG